MVKVKAGNVILEGDLIIPKNCFGIVLFAHGSGSSRHSPRNRHVASILNQVGLGTLLIDLLTQEEEIEDQMTDCYRFNIPFLSSRLEEAIKWLKDAPETTAYKIGLFGASSGAGAAIVAAAKCAQDIHAVVSRGGRPDFAMKALSQIRCPILLIVGEYDFEVIRLNEEALQQIKAINKLTIVPKATHLFEEPGALEQVGHLAAEWFLQFLALKTAEKKIRT